jgi:hypothetical protein
MKAIIEVHVAGVDSKTVERVVEQVRNLVKGEANGLCEVESFTPGDEALGALGRTASGGSKLRVWQE